MVMKLRFHEEGGGQLLLNLFRKKIKKPEPICLHEWHLIDTYVSYYDTGVSIDSEKRYKIACLKCNRIRDMNEYDYDHFGSVFEIKKPE